MKAAEPDCFHPRPRGLCRAAGCAPSGQPLPMEAFKSGAKSSAVRSGPGLRHAADSEAFPFLPDHMCWGILRSLDSLRGMPWSCVFL